MSHPVYDWEGNELMTVYYDGERPHHPCPASELHPESRTYLLAELLEARLVWGLPLPDGWDLEAIVQLNSPYLDHLK